MSSETLPISHRTVSPDVLTALQKTNPIEAAAAEILIRRGVWSLESQNKE